MWPQWLHRSQEKHYDAHGKIQEPLTYLCNRTPHETFIHQVIGQRQEEHRRRTLTIGTQLDRCHIIFKIDQPGFRQKRVFS